MKNAEQLAELFCYGKVQLERSALFDTALSPKPTDFDFDSVEGTLLV